MSSEFWFHIQVHFSWLKTTGIIWPRASALDIFGIKCFAGFCSKLLSLHGNQCPSGSNLAVLVSGCILLQFSPIAELQHHHPQQINIFLFKLNSKFPLWTLSIVSFETCGVTITLYGSVEATVLGYLCLLSKQEAGLRLQLTHSNILPILWGHSALILSAISFIVFNSLQ